MPSSGYRLGGRGALFLGAGCVLFVYLFIRLGPGEIVSLLLRIGWRFALILAIYAGYEFVRAFALGKCISAEERFSYWDLVKIRFAGDAVQFMTFTGPFLAEPARALLLRSRGFRTAGAFAAAISEYLIYTFTSAAMAIAGLIYLLHTFEVSSSVYVAAQVVIYIAGSFHFAAAIAIAGRIYLIGAIVKGITRLPGVGKHLHVEEEALRNTEDLLFLVLRTHPRRFFSIVAAELIAQTLLVFELFVLLRATDQPFSVAYPLLIESAAKFISMGFFFIPGQIGASEGVYALILETLGLPASAGFSLALARRLRSLLVTGAGLIFLGRWGKAADLEASGFGSRNAR